MNDDQHVIDKGWDALPDYTDKAGDADEAVTVSVSTAPGEWLVNTSESVVVPMSMVEVVEGVRAGKLTESALVWRQGMQEWSAIGAVPQLKLAARLSQPAAAPLASGSRSAKPPAPSAPRHTPVPHMLSRRSTLPFGMPTPPGSRPAHSKPTLPAIPAPPPEEPEVLAVYARPAATISFDLSPEQPLRAPATAPPPPIKPTRNVPVDAPQTLAPLTSDSAPRSAPRFHTNDLSVVAAADFRAVQQSSKRLVLIWSLGSAAAASLLTFLVARSEPAPPTVVAAPPAAALPPAPVAAKPTASAAPVAAPAPSAAEAPTSASAAVTANTPVKAAPRKAAKAPPRRRKPSPVAPPEPTPVAEDASSSASASEPNPYDIKLEEETPKPSATHGSGLDEGSAPEAPSADGSKTPGF